MTTLTVCKIHYLGYMTPPSPQISVHKTEFGAYRHALNTVKHESLAKFTFQSVMKKFVIRDLSECKEHDEHDDNEYDNCIDFNVDKLKDEQLKEAVDLFNKYSHYKIVDIITTSLLD